MAHGSERDDRVDDLIRRIERIEHRLGIAPESTESTEPPTEPTEAPAVPPIGPCAPPVARAAAPRIEPVGATGPDAHSVSGVAEVSSGATAVTGSGRSFDARVRRAVGGEGLSLERMIGGRWFGVLGAMIVLVGVGLFLKFAYDQGWIGPAAQCLMVAGFGAVLLVGGEVVRRRVGRAASIGPSAAGLGAMYFGAFAAREIYELVPVEAGLGLMMGVTVLGLALAAVVRLASLGGVAMIGGYLAPVLLSTGRPSELFMPSYLLGLLAVGAGMSAWFSARREARRFRVLRTLGWWGTMLLGTLWLDRTGVAVPANGLLFVVGVWVIVHAEMLLASLAPLRLRPELAEAGAREDLPGLWRARWIAGSFTTSAWCAVFGVELMSRIDPALDWVGTGGVGLLCAVAAGLALTLDPIPDVLRRGAHTAREQVGAGLLAEVGALAIATVALALGGWVQVVAWLALGVAGVVAGRWIRSNALSVYGLIVLSIAGGRLMVLDAAGAFDAPVLWTPGGLRLTAWSGQMGLAALAWMTASLVVIRGRQDLAWLARLAMVVGVSLLALSPAHAGTDCASVTLWWVALGIASWLSSRLEARLGLDVIGVGATVAGVGPWVLAYVRPGWSSLEVFPGLHPGLGLALILVVVGAGLGSLTKRGAPAGSGRWAAGVVGLVSAGVLLFAASSLEVGRVAAMVFAGDETSRAAVLSIWWGVFGVAVLALGFVRRLAPIRFVGLGLIGLGAVKAVVFDLAQVSQGWRVASFIGLGLLMIGVAVGYGMLSRLLAGADDQERGTGPSG